MYGENISHVRGSPLKENTPDVLIQLKNNEVKPIPTDDWLNNDII